MIIKNEIPLLEFDEESKSIIMPNHENLNIKLPEKLVFAFLYNETDKYAQKHNCKIIGEFISQTKTYPIYVIKYKGEEICFCQSPVGASASAQIMDWLISYGSKKILAVGSCGVLVNMEENTFLIPYKALRDEGASYHYVKPSRYMEINKNIISNIEKTFKEKNIPFKKVITWTTDGFYRETKEKVMYRIEEGCEVVEMECSALSAVAELRQVSFGQILFTADTLADFEKYDFRSFGKNAREKALELSFDIVRNF